MRTGLPDCARFPPHQSGPIWQSWIEGPLASDNPNLTLTGGYAADDEHTPPHYVGLALPNTLHSATTNKIVCSRRSLHAKPCNMFNIALVFNIVEDGGRVELHLHLQQQQQL